MLSSSDWCRAAAQFQVCVCVVSRGVLHEPRNHGTVEPEDATAAFERLRAAEVGIEVGDSPRFRGVGARNEKSETLHDSQHLTRSTDSRQKGGGECP